MSAFETIGGLDVVVVTTLVLLVFTFVLATSVVMRHRFNVQRTRRITALSARWDPLILGVLVGDRTASDVARAVRPGEERWFLEHLLDYARRLSGVDRHTITELAGPYLRLLHSDCNAKRQETRAHAVQTLSMLGVEDHAVAVVEALDDPSPLVSMVAAHALARPEHPQLGAEVIQRLGRYLAWDRGYLASMLARCGLELAPELRTLLADPTRSPLERAVAADALRLLHDPESADPAAEVLQTSDHPELVSAALRLLRTVGRSEHAEAARRHLDAESFAVRAHTLSTLGSIGDASDTSVLQRALTDESPWVALQAARALAALGKLDQLRSLAGSEDRRAVLAREVLSEASP